MKKKPTLARDVGKDVVLCETTNRVVSNRTTDLLLQSSVPFSKTWKRVPFFRRKDYKGATKICVISTNRTQYGRARRVLNNLEDRDFNRLMLNYI